MESVKCRKREASVKSERHSHQAWDRRQTIPLTQWFVCVTQAFLCRNCRRVGLSFSNILSSFFKHVQINNIRRNKSSHSRTWINTRLLSKKLWWYKSAYSSKLNNHIELHNLTASTPLHVTYSRQTVLIGRNIDSKKFSMLHVQITRGQKDDALANNYVAPGTIIGNRANNSYQSTVIYLQIAAPLSVSRFHVSRKNIWIRSLPW